jgi:hypothetical protein
MAEVAVDNLLAGLERRPMPHQANELGGGAARVSGDTGARRA